MELVFLTALGIGGATVAGALLGFVFKNISHRFSDLVLSFAAGVMLCAAIIGLILPSIEYGGGKDGLWMCIVGIFCGASPDRDLCGNIYHCLSCIRSERQELSAYNAYAQMSDWDTSRA